MVSIDWIAFSPWSALAGGALLGLAAAVLVLFNGRVLGVSGILGGLLRRRPSDVAWRLCFLAGMLLAPLVYGWIWGPVSARMDTDWGLIVIAGLLVGFGTRYGSGCTSGHGICGLSRLSLRSLVATLTFMAAGFVTVYLVRHVLA